MSQDTFCPYNLHIEQITLTEYTYTEDNLVDTHAVRLIEKQSPTPCKGSKCMAYRHGECHYQR